MLQLLVPTTDPDKDDIPSTPAPYGEETTVESEPSVLSVNNSAINNSSNIVNITGMHAASCLFSHLQFLCS